MCNCRRAAFEFNNVQATSYVTRLSNVLTIACLWRTRQINSRSFNTHNYSRKNGKNVLMIGYGTAIHILFKSILNGFFNYFSCYNKKRYRLKQKAPIFNAFDTQHHDCLKFGFNDTISVLEEVYAVYLVKLGARVTNYDIYKVMKQYYCITIKFL